MDFSSGLTSAARWLLKPKCDLVEAYVHSMTICAQHHWMVVVEAAMQDVGRLKGSGVDQSQKSAFLKALVELGESYIVQKNSWKDRSGLAGGLFQKTAMERARFEHLERDAFYYHYQNRIPFKSSSATNYLKNPTDIVSYKMAPSVKSVHCFITTNQSCAQGTSDCLIFGMGAHTNPSVAWQKSFGEYVAMVWDHKLRKNWCQYLSNRPDEIRRLPDFHHVSSRDKRNREIFRKLCLNTNSLPNSASLFSRDLDESKIQEGWIEQTVESPLKFIKYCKLSHAKLNQIHFGLPEPRANWGSNLPLFHPLW